MPNAGLYKKDNKPITNAKYKAMVFTEKNSKIPDFKVDIFDIYCKSRAKKFASMYESSPQTIEEFKKTTYDVNDIVFEDNPFQNMLLKAQADNIITELIEKLILEGEVVMAVLPTGNVFEKWVVISEEYKILENTHVEKIYLKLYRTYIQEPIFDKPEQKKQLEIWIEFNVLTKKAILKKQPTLDVWDDLTQEDIKELGIKTATFSNVAAKIFKLNHKGESLFKPILARKHTMNNLGFSICKEAYLTSTGLVIDQAKFPNGAEGVKEFIERFYEKENSIISMIYSIGANAFQAPVDIWNPQPRLNEFYSALEKEMNMADEEIGMHRSLNSDGKSNNKTAGQVGGHNTPSYNLILKTHKSLSRGIQEMAVLLGYEDQYVIGISTPIKKEIAKLLNDDTMNNKGGQNVNNNRPNEVKN